MASTQRTSDDFGKSAHQAINRHDEYLENASLKLAMVAGAIAVFTNLPRILAMGGFPVPMPDLAHLLFFSGKGAFEMVFFASLADMLAGDARSRWKRHRLGQSNQWTPDNFHQAATRRTPFAVAALGMLAGTALELLSMSGNRGQVFDWNDWFCYGIGALAYAVTMTGVQHTAKRKFIAPLKATPT